MDPGRHALSAQDREPGGGKKLSAEHGGA